MRLTLSAAPLHGQVDILPSKSQFHRLLLASALAEGETKLLCRDWASADCLATLHCATALGAEAKEETDGLRISPVQHASLLPILPCGESGSTLRFLLPIVAALGCGGRFLREGRLPDRPLAPLYAALTQHGCALSAQEDGSLTLTGQLRAGHFSLPGDVSSQYMTGLLFALPLLPADSTLEIEGSLQSAAYVDMTLAVLCRFGILITKTERGFHIPGGQRYRSPGEVAVEGDWSNAAFWLTAAALQGGTLPIHGLRPDSEQGDRAIVDILAQMGAEPVWQDGALLLRQRALRGFVMDAGPIPDMVPALAALAALTPGESRVTNAARLRLKESDRLVAVQETLAALGADIEIVGDGLLIRGKAALQGGMVSAFGDHRIAMMVAVAALGCTKPVMLDGAEAVQKSYPAFWTWYRKLGGVADE